MSGYSNSSWHTITVSILAGIGAGYLIGVITTKLLLRERTSTSSNGTHLHLPPPQIDFTSVITNLAEEVGTLRTAVLEVQNRLRRRSNLGADSMSDFMSARGDEDSDEEFFDIDDDREIVEVVVNGDMISSPTTTTTMEYLDSIAKDTMEKEDACDNLISELSGLIEESPDDPGLLWRLSRALVHLSMHHQAKGDLEEEKQLLAKASDYIKKALELDDSVWQSHKWYAIVVGSQARYAGTQQKITVGHEYKTHIDTAITFNPDDPNLYYLRGRWAYEVAGLSWLEKKAAAALYATPPDATFAESLEDFNKVEDLNPGVWKANILMIAKCHVKLGDISTAVEWLHKSFQLPVITVEDQTSQGEIKELLNTYD